MSFRTRLTLFFVLLVVVPMVALGVVVVRLVSDSEHGKASARGGAFATVASESYRRIALRGARHAQALAADQTLVAALRDGDAAAARQRATELARNLDLARVSIIRSDAPSPFVDIGDRTAIAGGAARIRIRTRDGRLLALVEASTTSAAAFARATAVGGVRVAILRDGVPLPTGSIPAAAARTLATTPDRTRATLDGADYAVTTFRTADFGDSTDTIAVLAPIAGANGAVARGRWIAIGLLALFLILAFIGALRISRQLTGQLQRFLTAARRIGDGDFSTKVPVEGDDEFASLGREFNKMSGELEQRLAELDREQSRLRESIQRIGATFAAKLDRFALLEIGTQTVVDAVGADCGRATMQTSAGGGELLECARVGEVDGAEQAIAAAETEARATGIPAAAARNGISALAAPIPRAADEPGEPQGIVAVARSGSAFSSEELELAGSLARQTGLSLENVELHDEVKRQAVTDELTGLFNHGRFQQVIAAETAAAQRFGQPLGLLMLDVDDFKRVNDTYGHPQGDLVLRHIAQVLRDASREIDEPARYGGEEMIVALPQTDLDGAEVIAERVRTAVEALELPRLDGGGILRVTVSCGVAASAAASKEALIAAADDALYRAKRAGKNRTVRADDPANAPVPVQEAPR